MGEFLKMIPDATPQTLQPARPRTPPNNEWDGRYTVGPADALITPPGFHCEYCRRLWITLLGLGWPHQKLLGLAMRITTADRIIAADKETILVRPPRPRPPLRLWRVETNKPDELARRRAVELQDVAGLLSH